jgi:hypothetical protein
MSGTHFQYEFSRDVSFVIGLPYLVMFECLIWGISYVSGTHFSI